MTGVVAFWHNPDDLFDWVAVVLAYAIVVGVLALPVILIVRWIRRREPDSERPER